MSQLKEAVEELQKERMAIRIFLNIILKKLKKLSKEEGYYPALQPKPTNGNL